MSNTANNDGKGKSKSEGEGSSLLRQTLMTVDECFVYKIPPMSSSAGHRAEHWDLAKPLQTCGFQVERRDNDLYLLFTTENHTKLFALSHHIPSGRSVTSAVQSVVDSSRYFVTQISAGSANKNKSATIGFGFRDRDVAIDLLGTLQGFQKSIEREQLAKKQFQKTPALPELAPDEKIHISIGGGSSKVKANKKEKKTTGGNGGGAFMMLKKPPKFETPQERNQNNNNNNVNTVTAAMGEMQLQEDQKKENAKDAENVGGAAVRIEAVGAAGAAADDNDGFDDDDFGDFQEAS